MSVDTRDILDPLRETLRAAGTQPRRTMRLATVTAVTTTGTSVQFDEEGSASPKKYKSMTTAPYNVGERVVMARVGSTYMVAGRVDDMSIGNLTAQAWQSSATIGHAGFVPLNIAQYWDRFNWYAQTTGVYTIQRTGLYNMAGSIYWTPRAAAANHLLMCVYINGSEYARWSAPGANPLTGQGSGGSFLLNLGVGTTVLFQAYQDGGAAVTVNNPTHMVQYISP